MSVYARIKQLAEQHHISISELERTLKLPNGIISKWNKNMPTTKRILPIADYFNVSVDYLLGRTNNLNIDNEDLSIDDAIDHAMSFDGKPISDHDRAIIKTIVDAYLEQAEKED